MPFVWRNRESESNRYGRMGIGRGDKTLLPEAMIYREPKNLIIQVEDSYLGQVQYYWTYYGKPCDLVETGAKTMGLTAIFVNMRNPDAGSFVYILCERLNVHLYDQETKQPLTIQDVFM